MAASANLTARALKDCIRMTGPGVSEKTLAVTYGERCAGSKGGAGQERQGLTYEKKLKV
jgi:hypothetical protein